MLLLLYYADEPILLIRICACYYHQQRRFEILVSLSEILPTPPGDRNSPFLFIPKILPDLIISTATNILSFPMLLFPPPPPGTGHASSVSVICPGLFLAGRQLTPASPFPWGSNALAFVVNDFLSHTSESEASGALGQGWAAFMVPLRLSGSAVHQHLLLVRLVPFLQVGCFQVPTDKFVRPVHRPPLRQIVDTVHKNGSFIFLQLQVIGRPASSNGRSRLIHASLYLKHAGHSFWARTRRAMHSRKQGRTKDRDPSGWAGPEQRPTLLIHLSYSNYMLQY